MKYPTRAATVTALTAVAVAIAAGTAGADPAQAPDADTVSVEVMPGVEFTGAASDNSSVLNTPIGSVTMRDGQVAVQDAAQRPLLGAPLDTAAGSPAESMTIPAAPIATGQGDLLADLHQAWHQAGPYTGLAAGIGGTAGAFAGMVVGCPIGAVTLGSMATVMSAAVLTVPAMIGGCLAGAGTTAAFGGMVGSVAVGVPVGIAVAVDKYNQIQAKRANGTDAPPQL
ncbi:hypothetical protein [Nocardia sp. NPDC057440]|uniref:hypothetical protein n=1 Tax=Nocardia sp. NPDC057440 TaxID=3346134 RepID=UPI00366F0BD2